MSQTKIAVVGASGVVGAEMLKEIDSILGIKSDEILKIASKNRPEKNIFALDESFDKLTKCKFILNASTSEVAKLIKSRLIPGQILIDNSSAFRMDTKTPLVVPEVNFKSINNNHIIANPNCTSILLCMTIAPLLGLKPNRITVSTYQAASGAGIKGLHELEGQNLRNDKNLSTEVFGFKLMGNIVSHNSDVITDPSHTGLGYNDEEWKIISETAKILSLSDDVKISATCMRVPVRRAHTESVTIDFDESFTINEVIEKLSNFPGVKIINDQQKNHFPMPLEAQNINEVLVGRFRKDPKMANTLHYILCGDQLKKGAALNAVQILKKIIN